MYAAAGDLETRFGVDELSHLAASEVEGENYDGDKVEAALAEATAEMNTFISVAYGLPLPSTPAFLKTVCCDIARYRLWDNNATEEVRNRYVDAIAWLKRLAKGDVSLGLAVAEQGANRISVSVKRTQCDRTFTRESLKGY